VAAGPPDSWNWTLAADPGAPSAAREIAVGVLRQWGMTARADDVELVLSELVTNALRHGGAAAGGPGGAVQVRMLRHDDDLVCAVRDGSDLLPARRDPDFMLESGRGLHLVACFAADWGVLPAAPAGKYVWALLR
jgi:anti-sigma regulatory factor (Ser/Thr protein kinase)